MKVATKTDSDSNRALEAILERSKVRYKTVSDFAYSVLRQGLLSGAFKPGQQLRQDALAEVLGISRIPVRSALFQLEAEGLIELRPHRGAVVKQLSSEQIRNIYEARIVLETYALRKAINVITEAEIKKLQKLATRVDSARPGDNFVDAASDFYAELFAIGNPVLAELSTRLRADVGRYWLGPRVVHGEGSRHSRLIEFIRNRDGDGAARWHEHHLQEVCARITEMVAESQT